MRSVETGGPADRAGVRAGDYLVCIDGDGVSSVQDVKAIIAERCNVVGTPDADACGVDDIFVLDRIARGLSATLGDVCNAYLGPP